MLSGRFITTLECNGMTMNMPESSANFGFDALRFHIFTDSWRGGESIRSFGKFVLSHWIFGHFWIFGFRQFCQSVGSGPNLSIFRRFRSDNEHVTLQYGAQVTVAAQYLLTCCKWISLTQIGYHKSISQIARLFWVAVLAAIERWISRARRTMQHRRIERLRYDLMETQGSVIYE